MEKKNLKLKNNFTQLITQISKLYKDVSIAEIKGGEKSIAGRRSHGPRKVGLCEEPGH